MKFALGRTSQLQQPAAMAPGSAASTALQQSSRQQQQARQLQALKHGNAALIQHKPDESTVSQQAALEDEEPVQGKFDPVQHVGLEEEEPLQGKFDAAPANNTGIPDQLKSGIESLSGYAMDDVKVHYNSAKPAQMQAHAYAQGTDIHIAPGQEQHLPHEAWHVVQQKQGRVKATTQLKGEAINDDPGLEHEADVMGAKALQRKVKQRHVTQLIRFEAGDGADWHVHKDHVKFGSNQKSRVDFSGRNAQQILDKLADAVARYGLSTAGTHYQACVDYINANY